MRPLTIDGSYNTRDLGGLITTDGRPLKYKVLLRSGNLDKVTDKGQADLINYGLKTVIDIRDEWEMAHYPNVFATSEAVTYLGVPFVGDAYSNDPAWQSQTRNYVALHALYIMYLEGCQSQIGAIISAFIEHDSPAVIHCHAGKDRTGLVIALILAAVGVPDDVIAADYALTRQHIQHLIAEWRTYEESKGRDMAQFERNNATAPATILECLAHIRNNYESVNHYLTACGITQAQQETLQEKLLDNATD